DHCAVEARQHVLDFFSADAAVQHHELLARELADEFLRKSARIGRRRGAGARAVGRRGAERHDLDRLAIGEAPRSPGGGKSEGAALGDTTQAGARGAMAADGVRATAAPRPAACARAGRAALATTANALAAATTPMMAARRNSIWLCITGVRPCQKLVLL